jgi:hypothetical protein
MARAFAGFHARLAVDAGESPCLAAEALFPAGS